MDLAEAMDSGGRAVQYKDIVTGASNEGLELEASAEKYEVRDVDNEIDVLYDTEALLPRHKRVTSGYNSENADDLSADDIDAEIRRVRDKTAKIKRQLAVLSRNNGNSSHESDNTEVQQQFQNVTTRDVRPRSERQLPSVCSAITSKVHHHICESAPTITTVRHHRGRQPTVGRQPSSRSPANSPVRQHSRTVRHLPRAPDQRQLIRRYLFDNVAEYEANSEVDNVEEVHPLPVHVSDQSVEGNKVSSHLSCKSKSDRAVQVRVSKNSADLFSKKSKLRDNSNSESESLRSEKPRSNLSVYTRDEVANSTESEDDVVNKRAATHVVSSRVSARNKTVKTKPKCNRSSVAITSDESSDEISEACRRSVSRSKVKRDKSKQSKQVVRSDSDDIEAKLSKKKSVSSKSNVSDKVCCDKSKKSANDRSRNRKSSAHLKSDSESDDNSCVASKRRNFIKPDKFNGITPIFATFKAHFENAAKFNGWNNEEQLAFLKSSLTGSAAQCL